MNSNISPTVSASLLALTTPFVPPPDCSGDFTTISTITSYSWNNYTETTLTALYSDPSKDQFTRCQPPGWDEVVNESQFHFSPGVCPHQWTAYNLEAVYVDPPTLARLATTAFCCASGYTPRGPALNLPNLHTDTLACVSVVGVQPTAASSLPWTVSVSPTPPFPNGIQVHNGYQISWDATDKPTLLPTPPEFKYGCSATLSMWIPGESVGSLPCRNKLSDGIGNGSLFFFLAAGVPIIAAALIAFCCGFFLCKRHRRRREVRSGNNGSREGQLDSSRTKPGVHSSHIKE